MGPESVWPKSTSMSAMRINLDVQLAFGLRFYLAFVSLYIRYECLLLVLVDMRPIESMADERVVTTHRALATSQADERGGILPRSSEPLPVGIG